MARARRQPHACTHHGRDSFEHFFRSWIDSFDEFRVEPEQVIERGDDLIAVVRQSGRGRASAVAIEAPDLTSEFDHVTREGAADEDGKPKDVDRDP